jgi:endonuclease YncB( thermonuclease family)
MRTSRWRIDLRQALFVFVTALAAVAGSPARAEAFVGQATVIDGDTIQIHGERIRMAGIDAPEARQACVNASGAEYRCGKTAAFALADRMARAVVRCEGSERDRYKRLVATCSVGGTDLGSWMVEQGFAVAYRRYSNAYIDQEDRAKAARRGLWAGSFEMPWDWRKAH